MRSQTPWGVALAVAGIVAAVLLLSPLFVARWQSPTETSQAHAAPLALTGQTTVAEIARLTGLDKPTLKRVLGLQTPADFDRSLADLGLTPSEAQSRLLPALAMREQQGSKDWRKIASKFLLWGVFLTVVFALLREGRITPGRRLLLLGLAVLVFGVVYGADQSPMGTVKDTIVLWSRNHILFPPRLIALGIFLVLVIAANKLICGWGCQIGTLQDLLFHLNRDPKRHRGILPQIKLPFALTNSVRIAFSAVFAALALGWGIDAIAPIDVFAIYNPATLGLTGSVALALLLLASLVIYRPWCHLICPFGLLGWVAERFSRNRVRVDRATCINCEACVRACPSNVMGAILKHERTVPDCFACGTCLSTCPTKSIHFDGEPRTPPACRS